MLHKKLESTLSQNGFYNMRIKNDQLQVYGRERENVFQMVMLVFCYGGFRPSVGEFEQVKQQLYLHVRQAYRPISQELLTIFVTDAKEDMRELCRMDQNAWVFDAVSGRLILYENQRSDVFGLRRPLQQIWEEQRPKIREATGYAGRIPWVTIGLAVANVVIFLFLEWLGDTNDSMFMFQHGACYPDAVIQDGEWWRLLTCAFLHFGMEHLLNNMLLLICLGVRLEDYCGKIRFSLIYFISAIGSSALSLWNMVHTGDYAVSAGASGAIYGLAGALLVIAIKNRGKVEGLTTRDLLILIVLSVYFGFTTANVDNWGHIGGMLTGAVAAVFLSPCRKKRKHA